MLGKDKTNGNKELTRRGFLGKPIPGLYAAGEIIGGMHGAAYMTGTAYGKALILGKLAGKTAMQ